MVFLPAAVDHSVFLQDSTAMDHLDTVLFQKVLNPTHQLVADLSLSLLNLPKTECASIPEYLLVDKTADLLHGIGLVHQILGGDTSHIQAGTAQSVFFKQCNPHAVLCSTDSQRVAPGPAAYHQYIKF